MGHCIFYMTAKIIKIEAQFHMYLSDAPDQVLQDLQPLLATVTVALIAFPPYDYKARY